MFPNPKTRFISNNVFLSIEYIANENPLLLKFI